MRFDLHVHSTASDGAFSPEELVALALSREIVAMAITDHDSVEAIPAAIAAARGTDLLIIPGVELSAVHDGQDVHVLGFFVDPADAELGDSLSLLREARRARARAIVAALAESGIELSLEDVLAFADGGSVGRSHVARALVARGHAADVGDAFRRLIGRGQPFYRPKPVAQPAEVIATICRAGGIPVLAHPGVTCIDETIPSLVEWGLRGLEAYHAEHDLEQTERYVSLARTYGLLVTGGSDFHGPSAPGASVGGVPMPLSVLHGLLEAAGDRARFV